jgi:CDP-diacylglycerol--glycerol-3-phosphate 3-phosphatidyltransferase
MSLWTWPNLLSFVRIASAPLLYGLVVWPARYADFAALVIFAMASFTDTLDGRLARRQRLVAPFGIYLDTTADKILVAVLLVALAVVGLAPGWMAAVIIAREFLVSGLRSYAAALGVVIPAGRWGKAKTAITTLALALVLLQGDAGRGGVLGGATQLLKPLGPFTMPQWALLLAVIWTIGSGAEYLRGALPLLSRGMRPSLRVESRRSKDEI